MFASHHVDEAALFPPGFVKNARNSAAISALFVLPNEKIPRFADYPSFNQRLLRFFYQRIHLKRRWCLSVERHTFGLSF
jgi:hypothetical protein